MNNSHSSQILVRPFSASDLMPIVALWNRCLTKDLTTEERFWRLFLLDPNFRPEGAFVAELEGKVVGFLQAIFRRVPPGISPIQKDQGWVTVFFVDSDLRRMGIASELMYAGLEFLRNGNCTRVSCNGYAPQYAFPGVDLGYAEAHPFLLAQGFSPAAEAVAMELPLGGIVIPITVTQQRKALASAGFQIRPFEFSDTLPLLSFAESQFPHWHQSIVDGLQCNAANVFIAIKDGEVVGYAQWQNPQTDPPSGTAGRFGPFGVHPGLRGNGLGAAIFYTVIEHVASRGAKTLWFGWAGGRNQSFYDRAGCRIVRRFQLYSRNLTDIL